MFTIIRSLNLIALTLPRPHASDALSAIGLPSTWLSRARGFQRCYPLDISIVIKNLIDAIFTIIHKILFC